jgi:SAM-dependent methyltransferase
MTNLSPSHEIIYNKGERLIPGISHDYMEVRRHYGSYLFFRNAIELDIKRGDVQLPITIVDLGCGVGHGCATLSQIENTHVVGVDCSPETLAFAVEHYDKPNIEWRQDDLITFMQEMPAYDYVISRGVIEHIPDGINLVHGSKWTKRLMFDVPYDEKAGGNPHHVLADLTEKSFDAFDDAELFFQDLPGQLYDRESKPDSPNMIMCCCATNELAKLTDNVTFPFVPDWDAIGQIARQPPPEALEQTTTQVPPTHAIPKHVGLLQRVKNWIKARI